MERRIGKATRSKLGRKGIKGAGIGKERVRNKEIVNKKEEKGYKEMLYTTIV